MSRPDLDRLEALAVAAMPATGDDPGKPDRAWLGTDTGLSLLAALGPATVLWFVHEIRALREELTIADREVARVAVDREVVAAAAAGAWTDVVIDLAEQAGDLSLCPYYTQGEPAEGRFGPNTCGYSCSDEPECMTCVPGEEGWPLERVPAPIRAALIKRSRERFAALAHARAQHFAALIEGQS